MRISRAVASHCQLNVLLVLDDQAFKPASQEPFGVEPSSSVDQELSVYVALVGRHQKALRGTAKDIGLTRALLTMRTHTGCKERLRSGTALGFSRRSACSSPKADNTSSQDAHQVIVPLLLLHHIAACFSEPLSEP